MNIAALEFEPKLLGLGIHFIWVIQLFSSAIPGSTPAWPLPRMVINEDSQVWVGPFLSMTQFKHPMMRLTVTHILHIRVLNFRVAKSLPQGHTAWKACTDPTPAPSPHPHGSPSSEEFPAESPTPHHSVPGMVQPLFPSLCPTPGTPLCPAARFFLAPAELPSGPWQASH